MADYLDADIVVPNDFYDIFDLPLEDIEPYSEKDDWNDLQFDIPMDMAMGFASGLGGAMETELPKETKIISTSNERTCRPDQFTIPDETTSSGGPLHSSDESSDAKSTPLFKTSSPVSILESSNSCFSENPKSALVNNNPNLAVAPAKRARSKRSRSRPSSFTKLCSLPFIWETNSYPSHGIYSSDPVNFPVSRAYNYNKPANRSFPKKKTVPQCYSGEFSAVTGEAKRCSHCEVTSTPQWREGPMGPKTLCNACGVRYRSGRLFPEYRPAASPTFVLSVHSNSHKKVVEMRNKTVEGSNSSTSSGSGSGGGGGGNKAALKLYHVPLLLSQEVQLGS